MSMEKYVVSRELAEKLKAAGYPQTTEHVHYISSFEDKETGHYVRAASSAKEKRFHDSAEFSDIEIIAAPVVDEVLEQLQNIGKNVHMMSTPDGIRFANTKWVGGIERLQGKKLADSLAELWLWCKENGYINHAK